MKVLWFSVTPLSVSTVENTGIEGKGWISSLLQIALGIEGMELTVAYENRSPQKKETEVSGNLRIIPINICRYGKRQIIKDMVTSREADQEIVGKALKIVEETKPDVIHVFGTEWCFGLLAKHVGIPVVIHMQGLWGQIWNWRLLPGQSALADRLKPELLTHPLGMFARYHYHDLSMERRRREEEILRSNSCFMCRTRWDQAIVRLYNREARTFHVDEALRQEFVVCKDRWEPHASDRKIVIVTIGACYGVKGPDVVLKTARLIRENTDYEVEWKWIGGTDDEMKEYERLTKVKADEVGVRMMGNLTAAEMIRELLAADMYVHTSYSDNSPNAVCEAQYLGLPVIATDTGGVVSLFSDSYDGDMLVPMNDPFYLAAKIVALREDGSLAKKLGEDNWTTAHRRHDPERIGRQLKECYLEVRG